MTAVPPGVPPMSQPGQLKIFLDRVAGATGLDPRVIAAWMLAENGSFEHTNPRNPLNIGPGRVYPSAAAAADATSRLLRSSTYAPVLRAPTPLAQLAAIAASPWDACHYRGTNRDGTCTRNPVGTLLRGTFARVTPQTRRSGIPGTVDPVTRAVTGAAGAVGGAAHTVAAPFEAVASIPSAIEGATEYVVGKAELGLVYTGLTVLALVLIVLGLARSFGVGPSEARAVLARPAGDRGEIPF